MAGRHPAPAKPAASRFSGWRIVAFATITASLTGPGQTIGVSVFVDHLISDLDLTRSEVSGAYFVGTLLGALALPRVGDWIDRTGVRHAMTGIGVAFGAALVLMSGVNSLIVLAVGFTFIRLLGQGSLSLVSTVAVTLWFERRRGLALGVMMTLVGGLMALVPVASNALIGVVGWRATWLVLAAVIWVVVVPIARFGIIDRPSVVGQHVDGRLPPAGSIAATPSASVNRRQAIRTPAFWVALSVMAVQSMMVTGLNFHQIALLGEAGLTAAEAALMFLPQVLGATVAGLLFGVLSDRYRGGPVLAATMGLLAVCLWLASGLGSTTAVVVYAVVLGAAGGSTRSAGAAILPRWFGPGHIGSIAGLASFASVAASAAGPLALSVARNAAGEYGSAAVGFVIVPLAIGIVSVFTRDPALRQPVGSR